MKDFEGADFKFAIIHAKFELLPTKILTKVVKLKVFWPLLQKFKGYKAEIFTRGSE